MCDRVESLVKKMGDKGIRMEVHPGTRVVVWLTHAGESVMGDDVSFAQAVVDAAEKAREKGWLP